jgi:hypothetical protein
MTTCEGCGAEVELSRGPTPRKWCSEACRKRTERARVVEGVLAAVGGTTGDVEGAVRTLMDDQQLEDNLYAAALAELAIAQARMADAGNTHASVALRVTLESLDATLGVTPPAAGQWYTLLDVRLAIRREGIDPRSAIGRALIAAGWTDLMTMYPPPMLPEGYCGTAVHGTPEEYAREHGGEYPVPGALEFWPES